MSRKQQRIAIWAGGFVLLLVVGVIGAYAGGRATEERQTLLEPSGTPVESISDCPWGEASCVLALGIERALQLGRVDAVVEFAEPAFYDCPGRPKQSLDEPFPLCEGSPEFTRLEGYPVGSRNGESKIVDEDGLHDFIEGFVESINPNARDEVGDGRLRLYAFGCPERATPFFNVSCARLAIILSAIVGEGDSAQRELLVFWAIGLFGGETLPVTEVWAGPVEQSEYATLFRRGGNDPELGDIYVIDQALRRAPD